MFRKPLAATAAAIFLSAQAFAGVDQIAKIEVTTDLAAIQNEAAATYWGNLQADLQGAIASRVTERIVEGAEGAEILVDIREVELANAFERNLNMGDAVLVGQVNIVDDTDNTNFDAYELSVSLETASVVLAEGEVFVLSADTDAETYRKLVDAFAEAVVTRLK